MSFLKMRTISKMALNKTKSKKWHKTKLHKCATRRNIRYTLVTNQQTNIEKKS